MTRLSEVFSEGKPPALIAYVTVGYPTLGSTLEVVPMLEQLGVDIVELGVPFSDPLVDGVTIQAASAHALEQGINVTSCLEVTRQLRHSVDMPIILMSYYNPILNYGLDEFCRDASCAGVDGLIIPDLPPDEDEELRLAKQRLELVQLIGPTSTDDRIQMVTDSSEGFIYLVSVAGVTGARDALPSGLKDLILRVKSYTDKPVCVGFGISTAQQAKEVGRLANGVVVGSQIVKLMGQSSQWQGPVSEFITSLREALDLQGGLT